MSHSMCYGGDSSGGVAFYMSAWIEIAVERSKHPTGWQNVIYHKEPTILSNEQRITLPMHRKAQWTTRSESIGLLFSYQLKSAYLAMHSPPRSKEPCFWKTIYFAKDP